MTFWPKNRKIFLGSAIASPSLYKFAIEKSMYVISCDEKILAPPLSKLPLHAWHHHYWWTLNFALINQVSVDMLGDSHGLFLTFIERAFEDFQGAETQVSYASKRHGDD